MKKSSIFFPKQFVLIFALFAIAFATAQAQTITFDDGTTSSYTTPFNELYKNSWHEMIYTQTEMAAAAGCNITKIAFKDAAGTSSSYTATATTLKIYMGERTSADHNTTTDWTPMGDLTLVYSGTNVTLGGQASGNWQTFTLSTPYSYSGQGNLVVVVAKTASAYNSSCKWYYHSVTGMTYPGLYRQNDSDATYGSSHPGTNTGEQYGYRANTKFTYANCCSVQRTGTFEFRNAANNVVTTLNHTIGSVFQQPTLVNNLTPAGTPTYSSSNTAVATVDASTGAVSFTGQEGITIITAYVAPSGSTCSKSTSYTITVNDGCFTSGFGTSTIGSGPIYGLYENSYNQMLYTADEIGTAGHITQIGFNASASNTQARTIIVYMGETTQASFTSGTNFVPLTDLTEVYSGVWNITAGWNYFPVDFQYSGTKNLVIAIKSGATDYSSSSFYYTSTSFTSMAYVYSDSYEAIPSNFSSMSSSSTTSRPNTKICIDPCTEYPTFEFGNVIAMCYLGSSCGLPLDNSSCASPRFSSSDPSVATIDMNTGEITTLSMGTTTILASIDTCQDFCPANASYELQVICPAQIPTATSDWLCEPGQASLTASLNGEGQLRWYDAVDATTHVATGETYSPNVSTTTTYYVGTYNTEYGCSSSRVPSTAHIFEVDYDNSTLNISGYQGVAMYGYAPTGSHEGATFTASANKPAWLTLNPDGSFSGTPTTTGSGSFTITATNSAGCSKTVTINWSVTANNLSCCDFSAFYIFKNNESFPLQLDPSGDYYYADVCLNEPCTLKVVPIANCSNYNYSWRLASSTGGLITESTGTTFPYTYDRASGYNLTLTVNKTGSGSCSVSIPIRVRVAGLFQVATRPSFDLCEGQPFNIYVSSDGIGSVDVVRPTGGSASTLGVTDTVFIPDGVPCNGTCFFRSSVTFADFSANAVIRDANDLLYIMVNMEHSFAGDIYIALTCPNGSRSVILPQSGSGSATCHDSIPSGYSTWQGDGSTSVDFGIAASGYSTDCGAAGTIGEGWNYIWSSNTTRGYTYAGGTYGYVYESANVGNDYSGSIDSSHFEDMSQIYHPYESFNNMIGCPLNGTWSIEIVDGWSIDDGHIFHWELGLNEELLPDSWTYTVDLDSAWTDCGWATAKAGVYMEITPPSDFIGTTSCDLYLRDEYGCTSKYENIVTVTMHDTEHSYTALNGGCEPYTWTGYTNETYTESGRYFNYSLTANGCPNVDTLDLTLSGEVYDTVRVEACDSYTWSDGNGQTYTTSGNYNYTTTSAAGCDSIVTLILTMSDAITVSLDTAVCPSTGYPFTWQGETFTAAGTRQITGLQTAQGCDSIVNLTVTSFTEPQVTLNLPAEDCPLQTGNYEITATITSGTAPYSYAWDGSYTGTATTATIAASGTCDTYNETLTITDANGCVGTANGSFSSVDTEVPHFQNNTLTTTPATLGNNCTYLIPDIIAMLNPQDNCTIESSVQSPVAGTTITATQNVTVTVTDKCGKTATKTIEVTVPDALSATIASTNVACNGGNNGTVTLSDVAGGTPEYSYSWTSEGSTATDVSSQTGTSLSAMTAGTYTVTITDQNGCTLEKTADVSQAGTLVAQIASTPTNCFGGSAGSTVTLTGIGGGQEPRHFTWTQTINGTSTELTSEYDNTSLSNYPAGNYSVTIIDNEGCTLTLNVDVEEPDEVRVDVDNIVNVDCYGNSTGSVNVTAFGGDENYTWAWTGTTYTGAAWNSSAQNLTNAPAGQYTITVVDNHGCQATNTAEITQLNKLTAEAATNANPICNGETVTISVTAHDGNSTHYDYLWNNSSTMAAQTVSPTATTTYSVTVTDANGCTANDEVTVTVNQPTAGVFSDVACDTYTWAMNGQQYTESTNTPQVVIDNVAGCDSTVTLNLTINHSTTAIDEQVVCETITWIDGNTYTQTTNTPQFVTTNVAGCDSTITLNVTVYHNEYTSTTVEACESYTWNIRNSTYTYTTSGDKLNTYTIGECSGVDTLHLTIHHSTNGVDVQQSCDYYVWPRNGQTYNASTNTPTYTLTGGNQWGCDSIVTLNLTILHSTTGIDAQTACDSYTWPRNGITYTSSTNEPNIYAGQNAAGCDSTLYLNLTMKYSTSYNFVATACDEYTWPLNGQTYSASTNSPTTTITNAAGCDSLVYLNLTVNYTKYATVTDTVCNGASYSFLGSSYPAGTYTINRSTAAGCDSIITLNVIARQPIQVSLSEYHSCELGHYEVTGTVTPAVNYTWSSTPNDPGLASQQNTLVIEANPNVSTEYRLTAGYGSSMLCQNVAVIRLEPLNLPIAGITFTPDYLNCDNLHWTATSTSINAQNQTWYVNDVEVSTETSVSGDAQCADDSVRLTLAVVNGICSDVTDTVIYIKKSNLWFPNVFTPNLNINKKFNAIGHGLLEYEMYIYTREGLLVFHTESLDEGWDGSHKGEECPRAAYTYIARYRTEVEPEVWHKQVGTVILLR